LTFVDEQAKFVYDTSIDR